MNTRDPKSILAAAEANDCEDKMPEPQFPEPGLALAGMTAAERTQHQLEVAEYVQAMCGELRLMAQAAELDGLAYFIDMARIEASIQVENLREIRNPA